MTDEQLKELQDRIMRDTIDAPAEIEALIADIAEKVARDLTFKTSQIARIDFDDYVYTFKATKKTVNFKQVVYMVIVNEAHRIIGGNKYRPYTVTAEIDNSKSYTDNLKAIVETFLRHISGLGAVAEELAD